LLVYGDTDQFASRRRLFTWTPLVFFVAIVGGMTLSLVTVAIIAVSGTPNTRLCSATASPGSTAARPGTNDGRLERALLLSWLGLALVWVAADKRTPGRVDRLPLGKVNARGLHVLSDLQPIAHALVLPALALAVGLALAWLQAERAQGANASRPKHVYMASTAALFVVILFNPVVGFLGYVGAHAVEYFVIVMRSLTPKAATDRKGPLATVTRTPTGRWWVLAAYFAAIGALVFALRITDRPSLYSFAVLFLGGLHVFYDGFIWKLRKPAVARRFAIAS